MSSDAEIWLLKVGTKRADYLTSLLDLVTFFALVHFTTSNTLCLASGMMKWSQLTTVPENNMLNIILFFTFLLVFWRDHRILSSTCVFIPLKWFYFPAQLFLYFLVSSPKSTSPCPKTISIPSAKHIILQKKWSRDSFFLRIKCKDLYY